MKKLSTLVALGLIALSNVAFAADAATCESKATDKKLAGAAKNSHVKKCMEDGPMAGAPAAAEAKPVAAAKPAASAKK